MQHFLLDLVFLFIYTHYMFRPSYKAIFRTGSNNLHLKMASYEGRNM
jgi:hypothetical protein